MSSVEGETAKKGELALEKELSDEQSSVLGHDEQSSIRTHEDQFISQFIARFGPDRSPSLVERATSSQLGKLIEQAEAASKRDAEYRAKILNRVFVIVIGLLLLIGFICWVFLYYQKADSLQQIITLLVGLGGGGGVGFGVGRATAPRRTE